MTRKQKFLVWVLVFTVTLISIGSAGCGSKESEDTTTTTPDTTDTAPDTTPDVPQQRPEGGFMFGGTAIMTMLAAIEDEAIDIALQEALDEDIRIWWAIRPEFLNLDVFPRPTFGR